MIHAFSLPKTVIALGLLLCIHSYQGHAQSMPRIAEMNELMPPSPNAASLSRYGGVEAILSTGAVSKTIPLRNYTYKGITVPIELSFVSNGIKVSELPSRVGLGWSLRAGGQISRVIYDKDDLLVPRAAPASDAMSDNAKMLTFAYKSSFWYWDTQPDVFSYSFGGYSGKFIFDNTGNILQVPVTNLKITLNPGDGFNFRIVTPDGIKYYFGGDSAIETSKNGGMSSYSIYTANSWQLRRIEYPSGYFVSLQYAPQYIGLYNSAKWDEFYKPAFDSGDPLHHYYIVNGALIEMTAYGEIPSGSYGATQATMSNLKLLKSIIGGDGSHVDFSYGRWMSPEPSLDSIRYYNQNDMLIEQFKLTYDSASAVNLNPILTKVERYNAANQLADPGHHFSYYQKEEIPIRLSNSQDHWGYFNGQPNSSLVPPPEDETQQAFYPLASANREPDSTKAIVGLLSTILYPTGGKDQIEYEPNLVREWKDLNGFEISIQNKIAVNSTIASLDSLSSGASFSVHYRLDSILLRNYCEFTGTGDYDTLHDGGRVVIVSNETNSIVYDTVFKPASGHFMKYITLPAGSFTLFTSARGIDIRNNVSLKYKTGLAPNMQFVNQMVGGMRVKRVTTSDSSSGPGMVTRYYYSGIDSLNYQISSAWSVPKPQYEQVYKQFAQLNKPINPYDPDDIPECNPAWRIYNHTAMFSNTNNALYLFDGALANYQKVTISHGGDNFENGAAEHTYQLAMNTEAEVIKGMKIAGAALSNNLFASGRELRTKIFKRTSAGLILVQTDSTEYEDMGANYVYNEFWIVRPLATPLCVETIDTLVVDRPNGYMDNIYNISRYHLLSNWNRVTRTTQKIYDHSGANPLTTITDYSYNASNLALTLKTFLNSKGDTVKQEFKYPLDFASTGNVYEDMVNRNMILPVQTRTFKNSSLLTTEKANYANNWFPDKHVVALYNVETQKAPAIGFEEKARYLNYNELGDPLSMQKTNDIPQTVFWGYKQTYPVASVVNSPYASASYSGFEFDEKGNWSYPDAGIINNDGITGNRSYALYSSGTAHDITRTGLNTGTSYEFSYWLKNGTGTCSLGGTALFNKNGWTCYKGTVTGYSSLTITGTGTIDELRMYPKGGLMTSSTFSPMVGMTSQCDPNNRITYYEYDSLNRLIRIRDMDRNILKTFSYTYQEAQ